jgi:hypothetical protein
MDIIVVIVILVICCCCIILSGCGYYFLQPKDDNTSTSGSNASAQASSSNASAPASSSNASAPASSNVSAPTTTTLAPATTPALIKFTTNGLLAHYDATKSSSYEVNGSNVTRWEDLSGNGYTLVNYGTGPKVTTIQSNGLSNTAFNFNPDLGMTCSDVPLVKNLTIFMVIKYNTAIKTWGNFMHHGNRDSDWSLESHPDSTTVHFQSNNDNEKNRLKCLNNKNYILIGRITSSLREFWAYSDTEPPQKTSATSVTIEPGNKPIFVGKSNINEACNSVIGEILYFNQSISTEDFNTNLGYLQQKWFNKN